MEKFKDSIAFRMLIVLVIGILIIVFSIVDTYSNIDHIKFVKYITLYTYYVGAEILYCVLLILSGSTKSFMLSLIKVAFGFILNVFIIAAVLFMLNDMRENIDSITIDFNSNNQNNIILE